MSVEEAVQDVLMAGFEDFDTPRAQRLAARGSVTGTDIVLAAIEEVVMAEHEIGTETENDRSPLQASGYPILVQLELLNAGIDYTATPTLYADDNRRMNLGASTTNAGMQAPAPGSPPTNHQDIAADYERFRKRMVGMEKWPQLTPARQIREALKAAATEFGGGLPELTLNLYKRPTTEVNYRKLQLLGPVLGCTYQDLIDERQAISVPPCHLRRRAIELQAIFNLGILHDEVSCALRMYRISDERLQQENDRLRDLGVGGTPIPGIDRPFRDEEKKRIWDMATEVWQRAGICNLMARARIPVGHPDSVGSYYNLPNFLWMQIEFMCSGRVYCTVRV
ncbi:hypothetical protein LTS08_005727 [Lithohypha guttulata]|nr:hypothetical protein LTS08_005727 [Lithohypha guttulata]